MRVGSLITRGSLRSKIQTVELRIDEKSTGDEVWILRHTVRNEKGIPDYGDRSERFIEWAADSLSVTFPIGEHRKITIPLPP